MIRLEGVIALLRRLEALSWPAQVGSLALFLVGYALLLLIAWRIGGRNSADLKDENAALEKQVAESDAKRRELRDKESKLGQAIQNAAFDYVGAGRPDVAIPLLHRVRENGMRLYQEGHYMVAAVLLGRAALLAHRNLGGEHPDTLRTRNDLAIAINAQGRAAEAEAMWRELLPLCEKVLGGEHPHTLGSRNNLAEAINAQGRAAEAETMHRELLALCEKVLGGEHPDTLASRNNLASAIYAQGRAAEAEAMWRELLPLCEKVLGGEHPDTLRTRNNLASAIYAQGRSALADSSLNPLKQAEG